MGMFDTVIIIDDSGNFSCPGGHAMRSFQTKDLDEPSMSTYLFRGGRIYLTESRRGERRDPDETQTWRFEGDEAISEHRFHLREIQPGGPVNIYSHCNACEPILVRTDHASVFGDIVSEHPLFVDFSVTFRRGEPLQVERTSGSREDLQNDLRERGVYVLRDDEPLAVAHRELKKARETRNQLDPRRGSRRRW